MSGQAYVGTSKRSFGQALYNLLATDYSLLGSRRILEMLVADVRELVEQFYPSDERMRAGWMVFTGTKATGGKAYPGQEAGDHELVTIAWPVLSPEDVEVMAMLPPGEAGKRVRRNLSRARLVRLVEHGWHHEEGPILLTQADLSLMLGLSTVEVSQLLAQARQETGKPLLTKGYYFDQGMRPTHKEAVIALYEAGVDEATIARRTHHAPPSVGRYIRDYERVKLLVERDIAPDEMARLTNMQPGVVRAYLKLMRRHRPDLFQEETTPSPT